MASSSSFPAGTCRSGDAAAAPPLSLLGIAGPSPWGGRHQRACGSTAQANLRKIIAIITTGLPPHPHPNALPSPLMERGQAAAQSPHIVSASPQGQGIRVDLRLRLGPPWELGRRSEEDHDAGFPSSACSVVGEGTTKVTGPGGWSSGMAAPETAESGVVSASYDGTHGPGMLVSNSPEERSSEGEWDAGGGRSEDDEVKDAVRAEEREEEEEGEGGVLEQGGGRPRSEITNVRGKTVGGGATDESDATKAGGVLVRTEVVVVVQNIKGSNNMDGGNEGDTDTGKGCRRRDEGYLSLLLEAVRQVSGGLFGDESPRKEERAEEGRTERSKRLGFCAAPVFEQYQVAEEQTLGPVVRSKRGRSQALPSRYRDSVLEPWRKQPGGGGGNRYPQRRQAKTSK